VLIRGERALRLEIGGFHVARFFGFARGFQRLIAFRERLWRERLRVLAFERSARAGVSCVAVSLRIGAGGE